MKKYIPLLFLALAQMSCSETLENVERSDLLGEWRSENAFINDSSASDFLNGGELYSSILGLQENDFYFLNYSSGEWSVDDNILTLSNQGQFDIIVYSDSLMTLKGEFLAGSLYWNLNGISEDETIILQEDYRRRQ